MSKRAEDNWFRLFLISLVCDVPTMYLVFVLPALPVMYLKDVQYRGIDLRTALIWLLATSVQFYVCAPLYLSAYRAIVYDRMDSLICLSTSVAYLYSSILAVGTLIHGSGTSSLFFETSTILLCLVMLGRYLELKTKGHTSDVLSELTSMQVSTGHLATSMCVGDDDDEIIDVHLLQVGDVLRVRPGDTLPTDGVVVCGSALVDESSVTGEATPVLRGIGDDVYGCTVSTDGMLYIRVTKTCNDNTLVVIADIVQEAQASKTEVQRYKVAAV